MFFLIGTLIRSRHKTFGLNLASDMLEIMRKASFISFVHTGLLHCFGFSLFLFCCYVLVLSKMDCFVFKYIALCFK